MIVTAAALVIVVASIPIAAVAWIRTRQFQVGAGILLDLWVAAGLLRLSEDATWQRLVGAAALIGVRKLVIFSLASSPAIRRRRTVPLR